MQILDTQVRQLQADVVRLLHIGQRANLNSEQGMSLQIGLLDADGAAEVLLQSLP